MSKLTAPAQSVPRYTLFDNGVKKVARYQQYFGVRRSLERVRQRNDDGQRKGGVIWHTQGSGKSLTMVMLAGAIEREFGKARFVLVTDRVDLDRQLTQTFRNAGKQPEQAKRGSDLIRMLKEKRPVITTLIHKFKAGLASASSFTDPDTDIFVLVDESHRSQTVKDIDSLHRQMRKVLPGAAYIGFTGTPLLKREKSTFDRFGGLIHDYKIDQAVSDKAVVPQQLRDGDPKFRSAYVRLFVDRVELTSDEIRIFGSKEALEKALNSIDDPAKGEVPIFDREWCRLGDSNT